VSEQPDPDKLLDAADPYARIAAKLIDALIAAMVGQLVPPFGMLLGLLYLLIADGMNDGRSPGKRLFALRVVDTETKLPATVRQSCLRNVNLALIYFLTAIPLLGLILAVVLGAFVLFVELHAIFRDEEGHRMGDLLAETQVVGGRLVPDQSFEVDSTSP